MWLLGLRGRELREGRRLALCYRTCGATVPAGTVHAWDCGGWGCEGERRPGLAHGRARGKGFPS